MRAGVIVAGAGLVVLVIAAAAFYVFAMPGRLASDYRDDAEPEQKAIRKAMRPVYGSLSPSTFAVDSTAARKAKSPEAFARAVDKSTARSLRRLDPVRRLIDHAKRTLEDTDEAALTEVPDWPLLGGRGDLEDAEEISGEEERYLPEARAFLKRYEDLVAFWINDVQAVRRFGVTIGRGFGGIPDNPGSPQAVTHPLDRMTRELGTQLRSIKRTKAPPGLRRYQRETIQLVSVITREVRGLSSAVKARDLARIEAFDNRLTRGLKRADPDVSIRHLVTRSNYAQDVRRLMARERDLQRSFRKL